jgi:pyruvate-formate lyase
MRSRVARLKSRLNVDKYHICVERIRLVTEAFKNSDGMPQIIKSARGVENYLDHKTIFIEDDELLVGNLAAKPMGMEASAPTWPEDELKEMIEGKERFEVEKEDEALLRSMDDYWKSKGRLIQERQYKFYDDRMWPFIQSGILCPPWQKNAEGRGYGMAGGTTAGGRFDQFMYPFFKKDKAAGTLTDEDALALLQCLRIKVMQANGVHGGRLQRAKWAGMARWNNFVIGGVTPEGEDAANELSYLVLESVRDCQTPHPTITVRVRDRTPEELMLKAIEVVKTGIGMPAFVGDKSYIDYFVGEGVPIEDARQYALGGCLEGNIPGKSGSTMAFGMFIVPLVFEITMNNGVEPRMGQQLGPVTGDFESFDTFDDFLKAFKTQLKYFMGMTSEEHNILLRAIADLMPNPVWSSLMHDAIKVGKSVFNRVLPFENGSCLNPVGMINAVDSLAAIKKLVFEDKAVSQMEMKAALKANWEGFEDLRKLCVRAPKYGNGDAFVDATAADLYQFWADTARSFTSVLGGTVKPAVVSITAHGPGGRLTGATPDGRYAGQNLADGAISPSQGKDTSGPTALIRSAMAIDQTPFQSTLLNMKFHPSALATEADMRKLAMLIKVYFNNSGKHIQFNVTTRDTLQKAQAVPDDYRDLIVWVAGYSAYYVNLTQEIQDDIMSRMEYSQTA